MRIAILGTRGIPNNYGGFEQCAEYLAKGLVERGMDVSVYSEHNHPYSKREWEGVHILHKNNPEKWMGTMGQFIYDFNCIFQARRKKFDIILQLGYTSSSIWGWMFPKECIVTTNMDGMEWKRTKFSPNVQKFLLFAERLGVKYSDYLIADSIGIQNYIRGKYHKESVYIPYGADIFLNKNPKVPNEFGLTAYGYNMLIARLEPENSIEIILDGFVKSGQKSDFFVVGRHDTSYGDYLKERYVNQANIIFAGGIYDIDKLNNLRYYSHLYFHGHTVGGTNPSLLEAMASSSLICAHDNQFNKYILEADGFYFSSAEDVARQLISIDVKTPENEQKIANNLIKIRKVYNWESIIEQYYAHFKEIYRLRK